MPTRILLLGPVPPDVRAALAALPGGATILETAEAHRLLSRIAVDQPDLVVEGAHAVDRSGSAAALHRILDSEFARAVRYRHPLSLLLLSIDRPDALAGTHGEPAIEALRGALLEAVRRALRQIDVIARIGENEFAVILPETTAAGGRIVADRTRALVARLIVKGSRDSDRRALPLKATVSVGVVDAPREGVGSAAELLAIAREAAARAASAGGDRVELA